MVSDMLLNKQAEADIERTKALTEEVKASTEIKKISAECLKADLELKNIQIIRTKFEYSESLKAWENRPKGR